MRFINDKGELDGLEHPRTYAEEVRQALSAMDGILNGDRAVYASSELTTGRRLYALLRAHGASDAAELRRKLGDDEYRRVLFEPNLAAAAAFARSLRQRLAPGELVVSPGPFAACGWSQPEYLGFWETLLRTRIKAVFFNDGWQYSTGCSFELAVAGSAGCAAYDAAGGELSLAAGGALVAAAARELEAAGFDATGLRRNLALLPPPRR